MTLLVYFTIVLIVTAASSHAAAFVEGGVGTSEAGQRFEPQVAMVCGSRTQYHAQHMAENGRWQTDLSSKVTCLKDKVDILHYCKKVYPERDITNIVESSNYYKVPNFCRVGSVKPCKASVWVKPFRCLEGSFQSDALLVPEGCLFDHIHNQSRCWEFDRWNTTADQACHARDMTLKSFAMLLPCGIDVFSGVEFVCCPKNYKAGHGKVHTMEIEEPVALPQVDRRVEDASDSDNLHHDITTPAQEVGTRDEYFSRFDPHEEHDAFRRAEQRLEERHREKVSKIMKEWSDLEERYQDLRVKDPRGAEEFKNRMTQRFQQTVEAVEAENEAEKHQLTALHQQRIVAHINEMKREAMTCYTRALDADQPNTHKVQKCLQKLLRALNKDRHHTVSHYKHLLNSDYEAADRERDSTLQHLSDLDRMVNQSLNMLARHSDLFGKIGRLMHEYAAALRSKDDTPPELTPRPPQAHPQESELNNHNTDEDDENDDDDDDDDYDEDEDEDEIDDDNESSEVTGGTEDDAREHQSNEDDHPDKTAIEQPESLEDDSHEASQSSADDTQSAVSQEENRVDSSSPSGGSMSESPVVDSSNNPASSQLPPSSTPLASEHHQEDPHVAHAQHHSLSHSESNYSVTKEGSGSDSRGVYFTLAFAGVALMASMIVGIVVLRRRNNRHQGFMEVDQAVTPEERHVTNMQVNGYENPTYKYFEEK